MSFFAPNNIHLYIAIGLSVVNGVLLCFAGYKFFQMIQLSGYKIKGYFIWLKDTKAKYINRIFMLSLLSTCCIIVVNALFDAYSGEMLYSYIGLIFYFYFTIVFCINLYSAPKKVPLKSTRRMNRLNVALFIFAAGITFILIAISSEFLYLYRFGIICLTPLFLPIMVPLVHLIMVPFEELIKHGYVIKAKKKLKNHPDLIKIGITGSFGKTSTKYILNSILMQKYKVCMSPHSFNTTSGLTRVVNDYLVPEDEVLITEMGARNKGDIKKLVEIIRPKYAIVTGVGSQHLHTFKTLQNIQDTKFELIEGLPEDGVAIFNGDNKGSTTLFERAKLKNRFLIGNTSESSDVKATNIVVNKKGTKFVLIVGEEKTDCSCRLVGKHNVENVLVCVKMALVLGLNLQQIKKGISELKPVPHRLELIENENGVIILDDSYNASVEGSEVALDVLSKFGNNKIVVTPGLVELGILEKQENFNFGAKIAEVATHVVIVNIVNSESLKAGLLSKNFNDKNIFYAENLKQANEKIKDIIKPKDVILFENDLPDNYI